MSIFIIGTLVNVAAVLAGGIVGLLFKGKIPKQFADNIARAIGLCACIIGIDYAIKGDFMLLVVSLALGAFTGELLRIDDSLNKLGLWMQKTLHSKESNSSFAEGFVVATMLFCVGTMAIIGSIESGLGNSRSLIFTKSIMDGVSAMALASSLGLGVLFSAAVILVYQGSIEFFAGYLQGALSDALVVQVSATGGILIMAIGLNMALGAKIKAVNLLPALLFAAVYYYVVMLDCLELKQKMDIILLWVGSSVG